MKAERLARYLGYAGLIPFVALAAAALLSVADAGTLWREAGRAYAAVILSFLGGFVWGRLLAPDAAGHTQAPARFAYSVLPSLVAWAALLLPAGTGVLLLAAAFVGAYVHDRGMMQAGLLPGWFLRMRLHLTAVVLVSLLALAAA